MLSTIPVDRPLGVQLLGDELHIIRQALEILRKYKFDLIDFNAACPVKKVTKIGQGASLLKDPVKLNRLLKEIVINSDVPVSLKIRSGWDANSLNARDVALYAQDAGIKLLFIHGRSRAQLYSGKVNYQIIKEVKDSLEIPVIGSGDAFSPELVKKMMDETGCDGVAIARGALGNPWIFQGMDSYISNGKLPCGPTLDEICAVMIKHLNLCCDFYGDKTGSLNFRKFFSWYTKGVYHIRPFRSKIFQAETKDEIMSIIKELLDSQKKRFSPIL
jgi:tRNA-dihydrouridine synthase B